ELRAIPEGDAFLGALDAVGKQGAVHEVVTELVGDGEVPAARRDVIVVEDRPAFAVGERVERAFEVAERTAFDGNDGLVGKARARDFEGQVGKGHRKTRLSGRYCDGREKRIEVVCPAYGLAAVVGHFFLLMISSISRI